MRELEQESDPAYPHGARVYAAGQVRGRAGLPSIVRDRRGARKLHCRI